MSARVDRKSVLASDVVTAGYEIVEFVTGKGVRIDDGKIVRRFVRNPKGDYTMRFA